MKLKTKHKINAVAPRLSDEDIDPIEQDDTDSISSHVIEGWLPWDPEDILDQMEAGVPKEVAYKVTRISDRKLAIMTAVRELAKAGDVILVAGKGHETYQDIKGVKHDFDDKLVLALAFES
jgi:hypothetical protein